jgi:hypothetical protein
VIALQEEAPMIFDHLNVLRGSFTQVASRRGLLAAASGGLLAARQILAEEDEAAARKRGNKRKRSRDKRRKQQQPKTRVDSTCSGPASISFKRENGTARFAQTFTAIASGVLIRAEVDLGKDPGSEGDYILRLSPVDGEGFPTNDVLAETLVANDDVPVAFLTVPFTFADPFPVEAGKVYALVLTRLGGQLQWDGNLNNPCSGQAFVSEDQTAPFSEASVADSDFIITNFIRS